MNDTESQNTADQNQSDASAPVTPERRGPLAATVVWGCILLLVAGIYGVQLAFDLDLLAGSPSPAWLLLGLGAILVVGGLIAALTRRDAHRR